MSYQLGSLFSIASSDVKFLRRQVSAANIKIIRYDINGQPIYGYVDQNNIVRELGLLGTFNPLDSSIYVNAPIRVQSPLDPLGTRTISGVFNNLLPGRYTWGSTDQPFLNLIKSDYSKYIGQNIYNPAFNPGRFGPGTIGFQDFFQTAANGLTVSNGIVNSSALYANPFKTVVDYTPRMISQTVSSQTALNRLGIATDIDNSLGKSIPFIRSQRTDSSNKPNSGYSGLFVLFGQYLDHGLDFIEKGGNIGADGQRARIVIPLSPSDPLYNPALGVTSITVSRATLSNPLGAGADGKFGTADDIDPGADGKYGTADDKTGPVNPIYLNRTSPYTDLSQAYGSEQQITQLLREWVADPNNPGRYIAGANLFTGNTLANSWNFAQADGTSITTKETVPTLKELRAHLLATGRDDLTWEDIQNYRVRDDQGRVLDADPNQAGIQTIKTDQAILLDLNPHFDAARIYQNGKTKDTTGILAGVELGTTLDARGLPTTITVNGTTYSFSKYINPNTFSIQPNLSGADLAIANELLLRSVGDHYVAGDGRLNENFGLTTLHHVFHQNHVYHLNSLQSAILNQNLAKGLKAEYFDNKDFTNLKLTRTDAEVNFNWGLGSPDPTIGADTFSVRWTGLVQVNYNEIYTFYTNADDGVRLWVNGQLLINDFTDHLATERCGSIALEAGKKYDIKLEYYENGGYASSQLSWSSASQAKQIIPNSQLFNVVNTDTSKINFWQVGVNAQAGDVLSAGVSIVNGQYRDAQGNYVTANGAISWNQEKLFEATRLINQTEYQHIVFEYAQFVSPDIPKFRTYNPNINADISLDYAQAAFRFGHSQLRETIDYLDPNGSLTANVQKFALEKAFLNPQGFSQVGPGAIALGMARQVGNETDEFVTPALQQNLLGQPLDLAAINIARGRDLGLTTLNDARRQLRDALLAERTPSVPGGLRAEYFDNQDFTNLKFTRTDAQVNFDWGYGSPDASIGSDTFSVRWTGQILAQYTETYTFYTKADDGVRLWVNGQLLIDNFTIQWATEKSGSIALEAGKKYDIKMEYYESGIVASAQLLWSSASQAKQIIPSSQLYSPTYGDGLKAEYFDNKDFTNLKLTRTDGEVNFDWGLGSPDANIGSDTFSVRWTGQVKAQYTESYTFYVKADDGVRLWVNGELLIDNFTDQFGLEKSGSISLEGGQKYDIKLEYADNLSIGSVQLSWSSTSQTKQIIPSSQLYSTTSLYPELHSSLKPEDLNPYVSWRDFGNNMIHPESLVNFIAAYSFDGDLSKAQAIIGLDKGTILEGSAAAAGFTKSQARNFLNGGDQGFNKIDLWLGGLAEKHVSGGILGTTFNTIFADQMERLQNGDRLYYLFRIDSEFQEARGLLTQIESEQFKDMVERTTGARHLQGDVFEYADNHIELSEIAEYDPKNEHKYGGLAAVTQQGLGVQSTSGASTASNGKIVTFNGRQYVLDVRPDSGSTISGRPATGFNSDEVIGGTDNNDYILTGGGNNTAYGEAGDDIIDGGDRTDFIYGGTGNDTLLGRGGDDFIDGGAGDDYLYGDDGADRIVGGDGNDNIQGGNGDDDIFAGAGNDYMDAGTGSNKIFGGDGYDTVYETGYHLNYIVSFSDEGKWQIRDKSRSDGSDTLVDVEQINFGGGGIYSVVTGTDGNDNLTTSNWALMYGGDGNDTITGSIGNDNLAGGAGNDLINGGDGSDTVHYDRLYTDYKFSVVNGNLQVTDQVTWNGDDGTDTLVNIEKIKMSDGQYQLVKGGTGNDTFNGSSDIVFIDGGAGVDKVDYSSFTGGVNVNLATSTVSYTSSPRTTLLNSIEQVTGSQGNDTLTGDAADNLLSGGAGNDLINGGGGFDTVYLSGSYLDYQVSFDSNGNWQLIDQVTWNGDDGTDTLVDIEQVNCIGVLYSVVTGTVGNDNLTSSKSALISGGAGNDTVTGSILNDALTGAGSGSNGVGTIDTLTGGFGSDLFMLGIKGQTFYDDGVDNGSSFGNTDYARITDFTIGDKIQLAGSAANYTLVSGINVGGQTGIALYRNNNGAVMNSGVYSSTLSGGISGNDDLIALIQGSAANSLLNLTNSTYFSYV